MSWDTTGKQESHRQSLTGLLEASWHSNNRNPTLRERKWKDVTQRCPEEEEETVTTVHYTNEVDDEKLVQTD